MPTTRPRHQVTETPEVAHALDVAARRWPDESRARLIVRLLRFGGEALESSDQREKSRRMDVITHTSGKYAEAFPAGYLADLRGDWPE